MILKYLIFCFAIKAHAFRNGRARLQMTSSAVDDKQLNVFERLGRAVAFYTKAVPVFASYRLLETSLNVQKNMLGKNISSEDEELEWSKLHDWGSDTITKTIHELKGFYVKTGQIISTRVDIFPLQYTSKLSSMQVILKKYQVISTVT